MGEININELPYNPDYSDTDLVIKGNESGQLSKATFQDLKDSVGFTQKEIVSDLGTAIDKAISQSTFTSLYNQVQRVPSLSSENIVQSGLIYQSKSYVLQKKLDAESSTLGILDAETGSITANTQYITSEYNKSNKDYTLQSIYSYSVLNDGVVIEYFQGSDLNTKDIVTTLGDTILVCTKVELQSILSVFEKTNYTLSSGKLGIVENGDITTISVSNANTFDTTFHKKGDFVLLQGSDTPITFTIDSDSRYNIIIDGTLRGGTITIKAKEYQENSNLTAIRIDFLLVTNIINTIVTANNNIEKYSKFASRSYNTYIELDLTLVNLAIDETITFNYLNLF